MVDCFAFRGKKRVATWKRIIAEQTPYVPRERPVKECQTNISSVNARGQIDQSLKRPSPFDASVIAPTSKKEKGCLTSLHINAKEGY